MQISQLDYNSYLGVIGIGRVKRGKVKANSTIKIINRDGAVRNGRMLKLFGFHGLDRVEVPNAAAGDIIAVTGMDLEVNVLLLELLGS